MTPIEKLQPLTALTPLKAAGGEGYDAGLAGNSDGEPL